MLKWRTAGVLSAALLLFVINAAAQTPGQNFETISSSTISARDLAVPAKAAKEFKRGDEACSKADWHAAIEHFRKAIADFPQYAWAYNNLGSAYDKSGDPQAAIGAFRQAISLDDHLSPAYVNLGRVLEKQGRWSEAEPLLKRVLAFDPRNGDALLVLSYVQLRLREYDQSAANAIEAASINPPQYALAHYVAGMGMESANRVSEAVVQYQTFLKLSPNSPFAPKARAALEAVQAGRRSPDLSAKEKGEPKFGSPE